MNIVICITNLTWIIAGHVPRRHDVRWNKCLQIGTHFVIAYVSKIGSQLKTETIRPNPELITARNWD